ncbi:MAG TPA: M56 family metallopeptidase, partial [Lentzea sp.]
CGLLLAALGGAFIRTTVRYARWNGALTRELDEHNPIAGVIILRGEQPVAFSAPGRGGKIAISTGMLDALAPAERGALLAHERAHLRLGHHRFLVAVTLAAALNPLLRPLCSAARFALERWADEAAAAHIGDRVVMAKAVAKAALAGKAEPGFALSATGGPVPRRVAALLAAPARRLPAALLSAALVLGVTGWSARSALDAAADLHQDLESAQARTAHRELPAAGHAASSTSMTFICLTTPCSSPAGRRRPR